MTTSTAIYKHVQLRHGRTRYIDVGTGPPLILLHQSSIEGGADDYLACLPHLAPHFRVLVPDLLGWPPSDTQDDIDAFPFLVDFLRQFQDALGLDRSHVCGVSMGGWIAGLLAYESPERIDKVIITGHPFTGAPNRNMLDYTLESVTSDDGVREWLTRVTTRYGCRSRGPGAGEAGEDSRTWLCRRLRQGHAHHGSAGQPSALRHDAPAVAPARPCPGTAGRTRQGGDGTQRRALAEARAFFPAACPCIRAPYARRGSGCLLRGCHRVSEIASPRKGSVQSDRRKLLVQATDDATPRHSCHRRWRRGRAVPCSLRWRQQQLK